MDLELTGKRILITGGSKGIGFACAQAFIAEGAKIALCSRSQDNLDQACRALPGAYGFAADLTDASSALAMVEEVEQQIGPIDILVTSAGAARRTPAHDLTPSHWREAMEAKFFTTINVVDPLIKRMSARGRGTIINIIGIGGKVAMETHLAGGAANAGLMLATAGLGAAYGPRGIRVVGLNPGLTETDRVTGAMEARARQANITPEEARRLSLAQIPLGRMARPEEIANMVVFLASAKASYVTGTTITLDGAQYPVIL